MDLPGNSMAMRRRQRVLVFAAVISVVIASVASVYYWDALLLSVVAALLWVKKAFTLGSLLVMLKKLPFLLLAGGKKLLIKTLGGLMLFSARTRFRPVRKLIVNLKLAARFVLRRVRYHWRDMADWERLLVGIGAVPLVFSALIVLLVFAAIPRSVRNLLAKKVQESTAASVIGKVVPKKPRAKVEALHGEVKKKLKDWTISKG